MDRAKTSKRLLFFYQIILIATPLLIILLNQLDTEVGKQYFIREHGYLDERLFKDGVGVIYMLSVLAALTLTPFFIWIYFLRKKISSVITKSQSRQFLLVTTFPVFPIMFVLTGIFIRIMIKYAQLVW